MDVIRGTLSNLRQVWEGISESLRDAEKVPTLQPVLSEGDVNLLRRQMEACVAGRGGEVTVRRRAAAIGQAYLTLDGEGRRRFLELLAREVAAERPGPCCRRQTRGSSCAPSVGCASAWPRRASACCATFCPCRRG